MIFREVVRLTGSHVIRRSRLRRDARRVSVAIPVHNRTSRVLGLLPSLCADPRIGEVVIRDDASSVNEVDELVRGVRSAGERVRLAVNDSNQGAFINKWKVVADCRLDWVVLLDSDNRLRPDYLDPLYALPAWSPRVIYCPQRARPRFDFSSFTGAPLDLQGAVRLIASSHRPNMHVFLNTGNYVVYRERYVQVLEPHLGCEVAAADVFAANLMWLRSGGLLHVLPGMDYAHDVHEGSWFRKSADISKPLVRRMSDVLALGREDIIDQFLAALQPPPR